MLLIIILVLVLSLVAIFVFNPFNLRTKIISSAVNSYLSSTIEGYAPLGSSKTAGEMEEKSYDKHPFLNEDQQKTLEEYGVDVNQLPSTISPEMEDCFVEKLGEERANEIVAGDSPTAMEIFKTRGCLGE